MIAALLLDVISTDFFEANAAHCDEAATRHDEIRGAISFVLGASIRLLHALTHQTKTPPRREPRRRSVGSETQNLLLLLGLGLLASLGNLSRLLFRSHSINLPRHWDAYSSATIL
jgi:hypothetical protein